jgi:hypothetical protein
MGLSRHLFSKDIDEINDFKHDRHEYVIGRPLNKNDRLENAEEPDWNKYFDPNKPLAGEAGIEKAISKGLIRLAARNKAGGLNDQTALEVRQRDLAATEGEGGCHRNYSWGSGEITVPTSWTSITAMWCCRRIS